jgi:hypothetical protein
MSGIPHDASGNRTENRAGDHTYEFDHHERLKAVDVFGFTVQFLRDYQGEVRAKIELSGNVTRWADWRGRTRASP